MRRGEGFQAPVFFWEVWVGKPRFFTCSPEEIWQLGQPSGPGGLRRPTFDKKGVDAGPQ